MALAASIGSVVAILSVPTTPELGPPTSALQFGNGREAIQFELHKAHTLEPFLGVPGAIAVPGSVPDFSERALR